MIFGLICLGIPRFAQISANVAYWNINGHISKNIGDKLRDKQFLNNISDTDILGLGELHASALVDIPGFKLMKQKIREKNFKGPKTAGGLAVFVRKELEHFVEIMPNDIENSIWIKVKKIFNNKPEDVYIGTYYVSPPNTKQSKRDGDFF